MSSSPETTRCEERKRLKGYWLPLPFGNFRPTVSEKHNQEEYKQAAWRPYIFIYTTSEYAPNFLIYVILCDHWETVRASYKWWNWGAEIKCLAQDHQVAKLPSGKLKRESRTSVWCWLWELLVWFQSTRYTAALTDSSQVSLLALAMEYWVKSLSFS